MQLQKTSATQWWQRRDPERVVGLEPTTFTLGREYPDLPELTTRFSTRTGDEDLSVWQGYCAIGYVASSISRATTVPAAGLRVNRRVRFQRVRKGIRKQGQLVWRVVGGDDDTKHAWAQCLATVHSAAWALDNGMDALRPQRSLH